MIASPSSAQPLLRAVLLAAVLVPLGLYVCRPARSATLTPGRRHLIRPPLSKMVRIPGGWFSMGTDKAGLKSAIGLCLQDLRPTTRRQRRVCGLHLFRDEIPKRRVYVSTFEIDRWEVTRGAYRNCVTAGVCSLPRHTPPPAPFGGDRAPIVEVTWHQAQTYCAWRSKRLPTEAEWEKAARGPYGKRWPWGNQWNTRFCNHGTLHPVTTHFDADSTDGHTWVAPVGTLLSDRSFYGVFDMAGNVSEWVADRYTARPAAPGRRSRLARINPPGPKHGAHRVLKGGSWLGPRFLTRAASRLSYDPKKSEAFVGFRCAR
jgi:formylglycine-generating enzyme required for sulfatase activity